MSKPAKKDQDQAQMLHAAACQRLKAKAVEAPVNTRVLKLGKQEVEKLFLLLVEAHSE